MFIARNVQVETRCPYVRDAGEGIIIPGRDWVKRTLRFLTTLKFSDKISTSSITEVINCFRFPPKYRLPFILELPRLNSGTAGPWSWFTMRFSRFCKACYQQTISSSILMRTNLLFFLKTPNFHCYRKDTRKESLGLAVQELMKALKQLCLKYTEVSLM